MIYLTQTKTLWSALVATNKLFNIGLYFNIPLRLDVNDFCCPCMFASPLPSLISFFPLNAPSLSTAVDLGQPGWRRGFRAKGLSQTPVVIPVVLPLSWLIFIMIINTETISFWSLSSNSFHLFFYLRSLSTHLIPIGLLFLLFVVTVGKGNGQGRGIQVVWWEGKSVWV